MKLNNHGWGFRDMIIYTSVILIFFFIACYFIGVMYNDFDENYYEKDNQQDVVEEVVDEVEINYAYYYNKEELFEKAMRSYLNDLSYDVTGDIFSVKLNRLVNEGYMEGVYDYLDNSVCDGYANAIGEGFDYKINTYIMCSNYTTEGYFGG